MSFTLTYNANNGSGDSATKVYTTPCRLEEDIFQTSGYELFSWNTMPDGSGTYYSKGQLISTDTEGEAIGGNLFAVWKISNAGQIKVINDGVVVDISDICTGITSVAGKNQPFSYITFQLIKNLFNDTSAGGYWETRKVLDPTLEKPELIQRKTIVEVDVYGIKGQWLYERVDETQNTTWNVTAVVPAYALKTTTLDTLLNFTSRKDGDNLYVTFTRLGLGELLTTPVDATHPEYERYYVDVPVEYRNSSDVYINTNKVRISFDNSTDCYVERVSGTGTSIVALILKYMGYNGSNSDTKRIYIDEGYLYDFSVGGTYEDIQSSYTQLEIETIKALPRLELRKVTATPSGVDLVNYDALNVELRPDEYCYTIIQGIGYLTNRYAFFEKDAYFVDYQKVHGGTTTSIMQYEFTDPKTYDTAEKIKIDWGGTNEIISNYFVPELAGLSTNEDQGSQYILQTQKVISENYEAIITISDTMSSICGNDIKYMYRENVTTNPTEEYGKFVFDTAIRNFQTKMIALNQIINWYKPGDCVSYNTIESKSQYTFTDIESYTELLTYSAGDNGKPYTALVIGPSDFRGKVYKGIDDGAGGWKWADEGDYTDESYATLTRDAVCKLYAMSSEVKDIQNGFSIYNVPLSEVVINYPSCVTTYVWGNPYFMDEESQISTVDEITSDSTLDNTSDTQISDNYAAKIVVGNQSLGELNDERTDFTGLILEKNWDAELYRLAGYENGSLQAQFNTAGKIMGGGGAVVIDQYGLRCYDINRTEETREYSKNWSIFMNKEGSIMFNNFLFDETEDIWKHRIAIDTNGMSVYYNGKDTVQSAINFKSLENTDPTYINGSIYANLDDTGKSSFNIETKDKSPIYIQAYSTDPTPIITKYTLDKLATDLKLTSDSGDQGGFDNFISKEDGSMWFRARKELVLFWTELRDTNAYIKRDSGDIIPIPDGVQSVTFKFKITSRDTGATGTIWFYDSSGKTIQSFSQSTDDGEHSHTMSVAGFTGINSIKMRLDGIGNNKAEYVQFNINSMVFSTGSVNPGAKIAIEPDGILDPTGSGTKRSILLDSNVQIGVSVDNDHLIYGKLNRIGPTTIDGDITLSNTALMSLVDAICGNTTAVQQIKDSIDGL